MEIMRATEEWQRAGAYYVRIQAMARKHHITLRQEFDEHDGDGTNYIILLENDFPIATARMYELSPEKVMIGRVVVLPEYRHQGVGSLVVTEAEKWAADLGYFTSVVESRDNKLAFYDKLGYIPTGDEVIDGETFRCIRMEKSLT